MGPGDVREAGENRTWTAHPADQTDQSPHRDLREYSRDGESTSTGEFVNSLLVWFNQIDKRNQPEVAHWRAVIFLLLSSSDYQYVIPQRG